jgi:cystathionine beta-lyase/cystathionine gamma-synthase
MAPLNAWLSLNGIETLALRMDRHCHNAMAVATFLEKHPKVTNVNYPGLESNPYHKLVASQMKGVSSLLSFVIDGTYDDATKFIDLVKIFTHATHLGTCKSIITHPASTTHAAMGVEEMKKAGISPSMIRLSVGIEDEADLIADLQQAFDKIR